MKKMVCFLVVCMVVAFAWVSSVGAIMIGFAPPAQSISAGGSVAVDITISGLEARGLDEIVSAYALVIGYDESILSVSTVSFGSYLDTSFQLLDLAYNPNELYLSEFSLNTDDDVLAALQPDSFVLATLSFGVLAEGASELMFLDYILFGNNFGVDVKGRNAVPLDLAANSGNISVSSAPTPIPEPATILLITPGLLLAGLFFKRRNRCR